MSDVSIIDKIRAKVAAFRDKVIEIEPAWLAEKRKLIVPIVTGAVVDEITRHGFDVKTVIHIPVYGDRPLADLIAAGVAAIVLYFVPNKPPSP